MSGLGQRILECSTQVRYVALCRGGEPELTERPGLREASSGESDRFEEMVVNPTLLTLTRQRGEIDCGGLEYVLVRYGKFFQLVHPVEGGHVSVAIEPDGDPIEVVRVVRDVLVAEGLARPAA